MDKLIFARRRRRKPETVRLTEEASALVAKIATETGCSTHAIVSSMITFCEDKVQLIDSSDAFVADVANGETEDNE